MTAFETPALMLALRIQTVELSPTQDRLIVAVEDLSGSLWAAGRSSGIYSLAGSPLGFPFLVPLHSRELLL